MSDAATAPAMVLGPMLRYVGPTEATVWLETSAACEAEVLGRRARTFAVQGHHYALVVLDGLEPGRAYGYEVRLDGDPAWPEPGSRFPPSVLRTLGGGRPLRLAFGSCRVAAPTEPRWRRFRTGSASASTRCEPLRSGWPGHLPGTGPTCSPLRNPLTARLRLASRLAMARPVAWAWRAIARLAGVPAPSVRWRVVRGPRFENQVATLELDGRAARVRIERG